MSTPSDSPENSSRAPEIRPALTPDQWKRAKHEVHEIILDEVAAIEGDTQRWGMTDHARAALCLHDHPAGFGWEDVEMLRGMVNNWSADKLPGYGVPLQSLADRIASLLPPKENTP